MVVSARRTCELGILPVLHRMGDLVQPVQPATLLERIHSARFGGLRGSAAETLRRHLPGLAETLSAILPLLESGDRVLKLLRFECRLIMAMAPASANFSRLWSIVVGFEVLSLLCWLLSRARKSISKPGICK